MTSEPVPRKTISISRVLGVALINVGIVLVFSQVLWVDFPSSHYYISQPTTGKSWKELSNAVPTLGSPSVKEFQHDCEAGINQWRTAQLNYPQQLTTTVNGSATYNAAVDIRDFPLPADEVIEVTELSSSVHIEVKCTIGAQLRPVGEHITIDGEQSGQWLSQDFTPLGIVEWSWSVTTSKPVNQELILSVRPAIAASGGSVDGTFYADNNVASFTTQVTVNATLLERISYWFETQWLLLVGVAAALGGAILTLKKWIVDFLEKRTTAATENSISIEKSKKNKKKKKKKRTTARIE